jgi:ketosteroid isomerase-like protein
MMKRETPAMTDEAATLEISRLYHDWADALMRHEPEWFERHIADDFTLTAHPFFGMSLKKPEFIKADMQIQNTKIQFLEIRAHAVGNIVTSQAVAEVKEDFKADLGEGMPTAEEVSRLLSGKTIAYSSAWRKAGDSWQCFDHHMIGPID